MVIRVDEERLEARRIDEERPHRASRGRTRPLQHVQRVHTKQIMIV